MKRLYILGLGLCGGHITLEAIKAVRQCGAVILGGADADTLGALKTFAPAARIYTVRPDGAEEAACAALKKFDTVGFCVYGAPFFMNLQSGALVKAAGRSGAELITVCGVSSFDAVAAVMRMERFSPHGICLIKGADGDETALNPRCDTFIFYAHLFRQFPEKMKKITVRVAELYPPVHKIYEIEFNPAGGHSEKNVRRAADIESILEHAGDRTTLFIPYLYRKFAGSRGRRG